MISDIDQFEMCIYTTIVEYLKNVKVYITTLVSKMINLN